MLRGLRIGFVAYLWVVLAFSVLPCAADIALLPHRDLEGIRGSGGTIWPGEMWLDEGDLTVGACIPCISCTYYPGPGQPPVYGYCVCTPAGIVHPGSSGDVKYKAGPCFGQTATMYTDADCEDYLTTKPCTPLWSTQVEKSP